jgi:hypothetical protein
MTGDNPIMISVLEDVSRSKNMSGAVIRLVEMIHDRDLCARTELRHLIWTQLTRLLAYFLSEHSREISGNELQVMSEKAIRTIEVYVRSRSIAERRNC